MTEYRYRDAVTGEYVTEEYAKKHPRRTVRETEKEAELTDNVDQPEDE